MRIEYPCAWTLLCATLVATLAACGTDSSDEGDQPAAGKGPKGGEIEINNSNTEMGSTHGALAHFYTSGWTAALEPKCETTTDGNCTVSRCRAFTQEDFARPTSEPLITAHAGKIEIRRSNSDRVFVLDSIRSGFQGPGSIWSGGEDIFIKASGEPNGVPAFETTVKAPSMITVSVPGQTRGKDVRIPRSKDLDVTWTQEGAAFGNVKLVLGGSNDDLSNVACTFPVESGAGKVPASALSTLRAGNGGLRFDLVEEKTVEIEGGWKIRVAVRAKAAGLDPQGLAGGNVILE